jgi:hypothetical protein
MSTNYLKLTDSESNVYNFPLSFWIKADPLQINKNIVNLAYTAGGKNTGDGFPTVRVITIGGIIRGDTKAAFETRKRNFSNACLKGGWLTKNENEVARRIWIDYADYEWGEEGGEQLQAVQAVFTAPYAFWEDSTQTIDLDVVAGNDTLTIDASGSDYELKPIIQIDADQASDVHDILFRNDSYGGIEFEYNNSSFDSGDILVIDCDTGQITRNGGSEPEYFDGAFLRLLADSNTIQYEGNACTIRFKYRKVYM